MPKDKRNEKSHIAESIDSYRSGYGTGSVEVFDWCLRLASGYSEKAKTAEGQRAMAFVAKAIELERDRRYPPPKEDDE
jgi:hypothetical protein